MPQTFSIRKNRWLDCELIYKNTYTVVIKIRDKFCKVKNWKYRDKEMINKPNIKPIIKKEVKLNWFSRFIKWLKNII